MKQGSSNKASLLQDDDLHKLRKFKLLRKMWREIFGYRIFLKSALKTYHAVHNNVADKILYFLYQYRSSWWLALFAGMLAGLSQPPVYAFYLLPFAFVILVRMLDFAQSKLSFFKIAALFSLGFSMVALYWPGFGTYVFGFPTYAMVLFSIGIVLLSVLIPMLAIILFGIVGLRLPMFRRMFLLASMWVIAEYLRGFVVFNFPFAFIGYSVGFWAPMFQSASIWGVIGIGFVLLIWSLSFYPILFSQDKLQFVGTFRRFLIVQIAFTSIIVLGIARVSMVKIEYYPHKVALVQGNGSVDNSMEANYEIYSKFTYKIQELTNNELDVIIWPEGVGIPYDLEKSPLDALNFTSFIKPNQTFIFNGIRRHKTGFYNSMYAFTMPEFSQNITQDGTAEIKHKIKYGERLLLRHDKKYLVPFGEYIPFIGFLKIGKAIARGAGVGFAAGKIINNMETKHGAILPLICYEITYSGKFGFAKALKSDYIVNITNDEWLGFSSGPFQHFVAARYRAVEEGLSVVRVSNNGFSAIIDPFGRLNSKRTNLFERDVIISLIPKKLPIDTFFDFAGNIPIMLFAIFYTLYFCGIYYFYRNRDIISEKIYEYLEVRAKRKKDPKYIRRF